LALRAVNLAKKKERMIAKAKVPARSGAIPHSARNEAGHIRVRVKTERSSRVPSASACLGALKFLLIPCANIR
jgi:hypothetical protein